MTLISTLLAASPAQALDLHIKIKIPSWLGGGRHQEQPHQQVTPVLQDVPTYDDGLPYYDDSNYFPAVAASAELNAQIQLILKSSATQIGKTRIDLKTLSALYAGRGGEALWVNDQGLTEMGEVVMQILNQMGYGQGLNQAYYLTPDVLNLQSATDTLSLAQLDALLSQGLISFLNDMTTGRINPKDKTQNLADIEMKKNAPVSISYINSILSGPGALIDGVRNLVPKLVGYTSLLSSLARLHAGREAGGWNSFSADRPTLKYGASHVNVIAVRQRLVDLGYMDLSLRSSQSVVFDRDVYNAVYRFQQLNFLGADGVVGPGTYRALDMTIEKAINQVRANLEKWRFLPRTFPDRYLFVDMGRQELDIMENNNLIDRMRVVVGKDLHGTPTMTDRVTQILLAPYWYPPNSIIVNEIIPKMVSNSSYLSQVHMRVLDGNGRDVNVAQVDWSKYTVQNPPPYLFRQDSGPSNSLGLIKFELTNDHAIYLHDTDDHSVFSQDVRYLSHGCIRLERPFDLAAYVLRDRGYQADDLRKEASKPNIHAEKVQVTPLAVYVFGTTTVSYPGGIVTLGPDIYGQDSQIIQAMDHPTLPAAPPGAVNASAVAQ